MVGIVLNSIISFKYRWLRHWHDVCVDISLKLNSQVCMYFKVTPLPTRTYLFWFKHVLPALFFANLLWLYSNTQWDIGITDMFFDAQHHLFPLKHNVFLSQWMHVGLKWLMVMVALTSLGLSVASYYFLRLKTYRLSFLWVFVGMVVSTTVVATLKHYSAHGCPWDLAMYGGSLPYFELFEMPLLDAEAGRCFPAGHPSGGFALMAFYFAFMHNKPRFATNMLIFGLAMGLLMGVVQMMRGAHFLSHVLWSGWVVWMTLLILYCLWPAYKKSPI